MNANVEMKSIDQILRLIKNDDKIFVQGADATPKLFIEQLLRNCSHLKGVELYHLHTHGNYDALVPEVKGSIHFKNFFVGGNMRKHFDYDHVDYIPCFLSEIPYLFQYGHVPLDVCVVQVSPPDKHGNVTLGTSVDVTKAAVDNAKLVIAQVNKKMPRVHGDGVIHVSQIDHFFESDEELAHEKNIILSPEEIQIGEHIAGIIEDGSTIQCGIGNIPDATMRALESHKDLGLHSEMWTTGAMRLIKKGVITNKYKKIFPGKSLAAFLVGDKELHDFVDDNTNIILKSADFVNNPANIKLNPKACAINSAVEIDLTGQICADSIGNRIISGVGGQMDFVRGSFLSEGGKPIMAMQSRTRRGESKIVPTLKLGAGVVTTRAHAHFIVTEYGVANLRGLSLRQRAKAMINIAHPDDRESLEKSWFDICKSI